MSSNRDDAWIEETICPNRLSKKFLSKPEIILKPRFVNNIGTEALSLKIEEESSDQFSQLKKDFPFLSQTDKVDESNRNKWLVYYPSSDWHFSNGKIEFIPINIGRQTSILMSNWIRVNKDISDYKLRMKIVSKYFTNFDLDFDIYDENMVVSNKAAIESERPEYNHIVLNINKLNSTFFRVAIKINYKIDKLINPLFKIESIDIGDPCVNDDPEIMKCNQHGQCIALDKYPNFECACEDGYSNETFCRTRNWCETKFDQGGLRDGNKLCEDRDAGHCQNGGLDGFYCDCKIPSNTNNSLYWVYGEVKKCIEKPKCIFDEFDPDLRECNEEKTQTVCKLGLFGSDCIKYDVCNETHRQEKKHEPFQPCKANTKCYPTLKNEIPDKDDYMCVCEQGYETIPNAGKLNDVKCVPLFCELPSLNPCPQLCTPDATKDVGYECKDSPCTKTCPKDAFCDKASNGEEICRCKVGFDYDENSTPSVCKPDRTMRNDKLCPNGQTMVDLKTNQLVCNCGNNYFLNDKNLCQMKDICAENSDSRKDCDRRNKLCFIDYAKQAGYYCGGPDGNEDSCPPGMDHTTNKFCINKCKNNHREQECALINAICKPDADDMNNYCQCKPGFSKVNGKCVIGKYTLKFNLKFKIPESLKINVIDTVAFKINSPRINSDLDNYHNYLKISHDININRLKTLTESLREYQRNKLILQYVSTLIDSTDLFKYQNTLGIQKCDESNHFYHCSFTLNVEKKVIDYNDQFEKLKTLCTEFDEHGDCFFATPRNRLSYYNSFDSIVHLVSNKNDLGPHISSTFKTCEDSKVNNISPCEAPADCEDSADKDSSLFKCTCNNKYFAVTHSDFIATDPLVKDIDQNETINEYCQIKTKDILCKENCYATEQCTNYSVSILNPGTFKHYVPILCNCTENHRKDIPTKSCVASCMGIDCGNGKCEPKGQHWACVCDDKYSGINCQTKMNEGGWIAAVAVLAVVVAILCGVAIFFARRKRSLGINSPSTRQLDDFSDNTSYRNR